MKAHQKCIALYGYAASLFAFTPSFAIAAPFVAQATTAASQKISIQDAERFLQQATFGYSDEDVTLVQSIGYSDWIDQQLSMPRKFSHISAYEKNIGASDQPDNGSINSSLWVAFMQNDQLRQRYLFALSQIFVNSTYDRSTYGYGRSLASYVDML